MNFNGIHCYKLTKIQVQMISGTHNNLMSHFHMETKYSTSGPQNKTDQIQIGLSNVHRSGSLLEEDNRDLQQGSGPHSPPAYKMINLWLHCSGACLFATADKYRNDQPLTGLLLDTYMHTFVERISPAAFVATTVVWFFLAPYGFEKLLNSAHP